ncbi:hypothetical protein BDV06DRAFT_228533, partial [Aspergillus oleicola]
MSLQQPLRRLALRPLNLTLQTPMSARLPTRRAFTLAISTKPTTLRQTPLQSQLQNLFRTHRAFHSSRSRLKNEKKSSGSGSGPGYTYQAPGASPSLSQRLKHLSKEYGWSALWIYLFLSALDFPFCFMAVRLLGADKIGHYEHVVVEGFKGAVNKVLPGVFGQEEKGVDEQVAEAEEQEKQLKKKGP